MLNRILAIAIVAGALAGGVVTGVHLLWTTPLIIAAEAYETGANAAPGPARAHDHGAAADSLARSQDRAVEGVGHSRPTAAESWGPADGIERTFWTLVVNVVTGVGGGLVLAAMFSLRRRIDLTIGLAFGAAAFAAFGLAPALGLPPELPGTAAAALGARQAWWAATAAATLAGLGTIFGCRQPWLKVGGLMLLALPHLFGAPHPAVASALAPESLRNEFVAASLATSAVFWIVLGGMTGFLARRLTPINPDGDDEVA